MYVMRILGNSSAVPALIVIMYLGSTFPGTELVYAVLHIAHCKYWPNQRILDLWRAINLIIFTTLINIS